MANNRIYLWCAECRDKVYLAKCLGDGYYRSQPMTEEDQNQIVGDMVMAVLDDHFHCGIGQGQAVELRFEHHQDKDREVP